MIKEYWFLMMMGILIGVIGLYAAVKSTEGMNGAQLSFEEDIQDYVESLKDTDIIGYDLYQDMGVISPSPDIAIYGLDILKEDGEESYIVENIEGKLGRVIVRGGGNE